MLERNLLHAGEFVQPVPLGLPVTLQYKAAGILECVYIGFDVVPENKSKQLYSGLIKSGKIPNRVYTSSGTLWVKGVIYIPSNNSKTSGKLPNVLIESWIDLLLTQNLACKFFAGNVTSTGMKFTAPAQMKIWLQSQHFEVLPGAIVAYAEEEKWLRKFIDSTQFDYDLLIGFFTYKNGAVEYRPIEKTQDKILSLFEYVDKNGYNLAELNLGVSGKLSKSLFAIKRMNLSVGDTIILDKYNNILCSIPKKPQNLKATRVTCSWCGKQYMLSEEFQTCLNSQCPSTMFPDIERFLSCLNLFELSYSQYLDAVHLKKLEKFGDILKLPEFRDLEIETSLFDLLDAIIPPKFVRNRQCIWDLCSKCSNSWDSLQYYLDHPNAIISDLKLRCPELVNWLLDKGNCDRIKDIIRYTNIILVPAPKKFSGDPIFRNKSVYLTGKFLHGPLSEVSSILSSYSAVITSDYSEADGCIVGEIPEDINGSAINYFKNSNKPIFSELEFFSKYELDSIGG